LRQVREVHLVDRVAILDAVLDAQILVLVVVILDRDREADGGVAGVQQLGVVAAAAEAVVAPDLADVEAEADPGRQLGEEAGEVARGRVVLAAEAALAGGEVLPPLPARAFGEDADVVGSHTPSSRSCCR
jgi:hypothetical protein